MGNNKLVKWLNDVWIHSGVLNHFTAFCTLLYLQWWESASVGVSFRRSPSPTIFLWITQGTRLSFKSKLECPSTWKHVYSAFLGQPGDQIRTTDSGQMGRREPRTEGPRGNRSDGMAANANRTLWQDCVVNVTAMHVYRINISQKETPLKRGGGHLHAWRLQK